LWRSAACVNDVASALIVEKETDMKNLTLTCTKAFLNKNSGFFQGKYQIFLSIVYLPTAKNNESYIRAI
jgi:hypothetical protein